MARAHSETTAGCEMTTLTLRRIKDHFVVTAPDFEPMRFKTRPEAKDWCRWHHPRVPIIEIGRDRSKRMVGGSMGRPRKAEG
jgi:hypothetical protein